MLRKNYFSASPVASFTSSAGASFGWFLRSLSACLATDFFADGSLYHFGSLTPFFLRIKATREEGWAPLFKYFSTASLSRVNFFVAGL